jgi:hypothetical protein
MLVGVGRRGGESPGTGAPPGLDPRNVLIHFVPQSLAQTTQLALGVRPTAASTSLHSCDEHIQSRDDRASLPGNVLNRCAQLGTRNAGELGRHQ